jgi:hypothetical protein
VQEVQAEAVKVKVLLRQFQELLIQAAVVVVVQLHTVLLVQAVQA